MNSHEKMRQARQHRESIRSQDKHTAELKKSNVLATRSLAEDKKANEIAELALAEAQSANKTARKAKFWAAVSVVIAVVSAGIALASLLRSC